MSLIKLHFVNNSCNPILNNIGGDANISKDKFESFLKIKIVFNKITFCE